MRAGDLDRRITFLARTREPDAVGQMIETWTPALTTWAAIEPKPGGEQFQGDQVVATAVRQFRVRKRDAFRPTVEGHRIDAEGREWDIHDVREIDGGYEIDATARGEG